MTYLLKIHLEYKEEVIREIEIDSSNNLEELHQSIINSFELNTNELASFYITNDNLDLIKEVPLYTFDPEDKDILTMKEVVISSVLTNIGGQLLYVYDFLKMWRFLISLSKKNKDDLKKARCINYIGKIPKDAPDIKFDTLKELDPVNNYE